MIYKFANNDIPLVVNSDNAAADKVRFTWEQTLKHPTNCVP